MKIIIIRKKKKKAEDLKKICDKESIPVNFNSLPSITPPKKSIIKLNANIQINSTNYQKKNLPSISQSQVISNPISTMNKFSKNILNKDDKEETWIFYILSSQNLPTKKMKKKKIIKKMKIRIIKIRKKVMKIMKKKMES